MCDEGRATGVELRAEDGRLHGVLYPGQRIEVMRGGVLTIYDVLTGRRVASRRVRVRGDRRGRGGEITR